MECCRHGGMGKTSKAISSAAGASTVPAVLAEALAVLHSARVAEARLKAEYILSRVLGCHRLELPLHPHRALTASESGLMAAQIERAVKGEPIQYVLGDTEFMGRVFKTDARALIPRPETETLVEQALACREVWSLRQPVVADVGTGTGCIVVTLALERPGGEFLAVDASAAALDLARENAATLGVAERIRFSQGDLLSGIRPGSLDLVVSNPPYIATAEIETLQADIREHEPRLALDGGPEGMNAISKLVPQAFDCLRPGGRLFMEIGEDQGERVKARMESSGFERIEIQRDLNGHDRIARGRRL